MLPSLLVFSFILLFLEYNTTVSPFLMRLSGNQKGNSILLDIPSSDISFVLNAIKSPKLQSDITLKTDLSESRSPYLLYI